MQTVLTVLLVRFALVVGGLVVLALVLFAIALFLKRRGRLDRARVDRVRRGAAPAARAVADRLDTGGARGGRSRASAGAARLLAGWLEDTDRRASGSGSRRDGSR
ncbi:hypothetical protein [Streptomyces sp. ODS28]|uniref:hypothetical protein n=1 Tax=Streptomyces sp. ODS28 TaxID=3136688 RepID=UPI0031E60D69